MKKISCILCHKADGKRVCQINDNALICPVCCARTRTINCAGCVYYIQAEKYNREKSLTPKLKPFIIALEPDINEQVDRALVMVEKGNAEKAEGTLLSLLKEHPTNAMVQYGMGVVCFIKNQFKEAILFFDRALAINPSLVEAWYNKGSAHQKMLEIRPMFKAYRKVIALGDPSQDYVIQVKNVIMGLENKIGKSYHLSLDEYLDGMEIFDDAFAAMERMESEQAISGFKKVLSLVPDHIQSHGNLGLCYAQLGKKQEALAHLDRALELDPGYEPAIVNRRAISLLAEGEKLPAMAITPVEYYKDFKIKKESLVDRLFKR